MEKVILAVLVSAVIVALIWLMVSLRRGWERQNRLISRMRRESDRQGRAIMRLSEGLNASMRQMSELSSSLESRQERLRQTLDARVSQMILQNDQSLERVRLTVSDKLDGRLNESFRTVNAQLAGVHRGLGEMRELSTSMADLRKMLGGVKTRGIWGEVQLRALMAECFAPNQYVENAPIPAGSQQRVEFALKLPEADGGDRLLPIDSKFPQEDFLRLIEAQEAGDAEAVKRCAAQLERAVLEQARRIHDKYIQPPQTVDFAILFLPTESLYAEVARLNGLLERIQEKYRVLISGPATFYALVTSLQLGLRSISLERRSGEVLRQLSAMKQDFESFGTSVQRMRQRLSQVSAELDTLEARSRRVVRAIENVDSD